jgi:UDPglucose 6-dehydrogenase
MLMVDKIENVLGDLKGKRLGILGLTFKPNTDDIRDSPAISIIETLLKKGAVVSAYDPAGMEAAAEILKGVNYVNDIYEASQDADALVIVTEWNEFRYPDWEKVQASLRSPIVIDMRNIYEPEKMKTRGFNYHCVGRCHE